MAGRRIKDQGRVGKGMNTIKVHPMKKIIKIRKIEPCKLDSEGRSIKINKDIINLRIIF